MKNSDLEVESSPKTGLVKKLLSIIKLF